MKNPIKTIKPFVAKYEPELLIGMGVGGLVFSTVWAIKATFKASDAIRQYKEKKQIDKLTKKEYFDLTWRYYIPVVGSIVLSIPCIIAGNHASEKRYAALATAYTISKSALQEYQNKTLELVGPKKEQQIREEISKDKIKSTYEGGTQIIMTGNGDCLFYEPLSGRYFKSNWNDISKAANELNARSLADVCGHITVNEWFEKLGLDPIDVGDDIGWKLLGGNASLIDISMSSHVTKDNVPCGAISYRRKPEPISGSLY